MGKDSRKKSTKGASYERTSRLYFPYQVTSSGENIGSVLVSSPARIPLYQAFSAIQAGVPASLIRSEGLDVVNVEGNALVMPLTERGAKLFQKHAPDLAVVKIEDGYQISLQS